jgi:hypothetical protein
MARTLSEKGPDRDVHGPDGPLSAKSVCKPKRRNGAGGPNGPSAPLPWIRPLGSFERRERREFQVTRFG